MPLIEDAEFERLLKEVEHRPDPIYTEIPSGLNLSLVNILKAYVECVGRGTAEGAIPREVYDSYLEHTNAYRKALAEADPDATVDAYIAQQPQRPARKVNEDLR